MLHHDDYDVVLRRFPATKFAFSYGSGTIEQKGYEYKCNGDTSNVPMVDFIFAVEDSEAWHEENMILNPTHYTPFFAMTAAQVATVQDAYGAGVWFNTMVPLPVDRYPGRLMKYGVISTARLQKDLLEWSDLYVAGRLHKPVRILQSNSAFEANLLSNMRSAARVALLLLPRLFSEADLFMKIASLSYSGDPRMIIGENPKKIENLVSGTISEYRRIYESIVVNLPAGVIKSELRPGVGTTSSRIIYQQCTDPETRLSLFKSLPRNVLVSLNLSEASKVGANFLVPNHSMLACSVANIVKRTSTSQSLKGIVTSGAVKCGIYVAAKMVKRLK